MANNVFLVVLPILSYFTNIYSTACLFYSLYKKTIPEVWNVFIPIKCNC